MFAVREQPGSLPISRRTILYIEDDEIDQMAFVRAVHELGIPYQYQIVGSCCEAVRVLQEKSFDAVVSDYNLPDGTVFDIIELIMMSSAPLIVITGAGDQEIAVKALQNGAADYLVKDSERAYLKMLSQSVEHAISRIAQDRLLKKIDTAVQQTGTAIAITETDGSISHINPQLLSQIGRSAEEVIGSSLSSLFSDIETYKQALLAAKNEGVWRGEVYSLKPDRGCLYEFITLSSILDSEDRFLGFLYSSMDITPLKEAEQALELEKDHLEITLRAISDGVIAIDHAGRVLFINPYARSFSLLPGDLANTPISEFFIPKKLTTGEVVSDLSWLSATHDPQKAMRYRLFHPQINEDRLIDIQVNTLPLPDDSCGSVIVFRDVTEIVRRDEERSRLSQLESIGQLAGGIAHDFNNILTIILSNIQMAKEPLTEQSVREERLTAALEAVSRAKALSKHFLTLSPGGEPVKEKIDIDSFLRGAPGGYMKGGSIQLTYEIATPLPFVYADPTQLGIAIHQIAKNAIEAMGESGQLLIRAYMRDVSNDPDTVLKKEVVIEICDTGPGIPADILPKVFEPYFSTKKGIQGMGLAIAHSIIVQHTGTISIVSAPGTGTRVIITLPVDSLKEEIPVKRNVGGRGNRVLVMDDEVRISEVLSLMLQRMGYKIDTAPDGERAVSLFDDARMQGDEFAVVILDLVIPEGLGGKETVSLLRSRDPDIPIIVSSGYSNDPVMADYQRFGFSDSLPKPYTKKALEEKMDCWAPL